MAKTLATNLSVSVQGNYAKAFDLQNAGCNLQHAVAEAMATGVGAAQADLIFHDTRTATATPDNLDLAAALTDVFSDSLTFARVKLIFIHNKSLTDDLKVGGHASAALDTLFNATTDEIIIKPGGILLVYAPGATAYVVTATTADMLTVDPGAATIIYDVIIIGASA